MNSKEIAQELKEGAQFGNDVAGWFTLINVKAGRFMIQIGDDIRQYKNLNSVSRRIMQLANRGY